MKTTYCFYLFLLLFSYSFSSFAQEEKPFVIIDNISIEGTVYTVKSKTAKTSFTLQLCTIDSCYTTNEYAKNIRPELLTNDLIAFTKLKIDTNLIEVNVTDEERKKMETLVATVKKNEAEINEANKTEAERLLGIIDDEKDEYSGLLKLNIKVPYKIATTLKNSKNKDSIVITSSTVDLSIEKAYLSFFNNKASTIVIVAKEKDAAHSITFINNKFSVPLRYFNLYGSEVSATNKNGHVLTIDYNDVFDYEPDQHFNYSVANSELTLTKAKPEGKVIQRRFFDFFTAVLFTDILGINTENSNALINAQAKLLIPLNQRNIVYFPRFTAFRQITTEANVTLYNNSQEDIRFIEVENDGTFSNFDLLRKSNLSGRIGAELISFEAKAWFLNISTGYSLSFYKTGLRVTKTLNNVKDEVFSQQLFSISHGPSLNFEIRPQTNFGADIFISLEDLNYNDVKTIDDRSVENDLMIDTGKNDFFFKYNIVNLEANFYWLTNPTKSKGGIYAKLGGYYHTEAHSVYPRILVGYATNLTSFVNRFKAKKP